MSAIPNTQATDWEDRYLDLLNQPERSFVQDFLRLYYRHHGTLSKFYRREKQPMSMRTDVAIVGARHHPGAMDALALMDKVVREPDGRIKIHLVREPQNKFDKNAVAVWVHRRNGLDRTKWEKIHLGYVPRTDAIGLARIMDAGVAPCAIYKGNAFMSVYWPASTKEAVAVEWERAMG